MAKERIDASEAVREWHKASYQRCIAAGVKIAAGTDAGGGDPMRHGKHRKGVGSYGRLGPEPHGGPEGRHLYGGRTGGNLQ